MRRWLLLPVLLLAAPGPKAPDLRPTTEAPFRLILIDPVGKQAPGKQCGEDACQALLQLIEGAKTSIDFAIYGIRGQQDVFDALVKAEARGVTVRGYIDRTLDGQNYYSDSEALVKTLRGVKDDLEVDRRKAATQTGYDPETSMCWWPSPAGFLGPKQCVGYDLGDKCVVAVHASEEALSFQGDIMHNKFFVVDGQYVWMGSTNVSDSCSGGYNANVVGVLSSPVLASWYTKEFEQLWSGVGHDEKQSQGQLSTQLSSTVHVEAYFSPQDKPMTRAVRPLLQKARERIDVPIFFLTHKGVTKDLIDAHQRGVKVRILIDATAATNGYTKHELARVAGIPVKIENWGGKMHMKAAAIDGEILVIGSMNWTSAGENGNDENTLVIRSREHAAQLHTFFDHLWASVPDRWLEGRPDPESLDSTTSCTDGTDNDFDHTQDAGDPGCGPNPPPLPPLPPYLVIPKGPGQQLIKGNVSSNGRRLYHLPGGEWYDRVEINAEEGEQYFCSEEDARAAGFQRSSK